MTVLEIVDLTPIGPLLATVSSIENGEWLPAGLSALVFGLDGAALVTNPLGAGASLLANAAMEHIYPLTCLLDKLAVQPAEARARAGIVAAGAAAIRADLTVLENATFPLWEGHAARAHAAARSSLAAAMGATADALSGLSTAMDVMATVVAAVRDFVRGLIADAVGTLTAAATATVVTGGVGAGIAVAGTAVQVSRLVARAGQKITELLDATKKLDALVADLVKSLRELKLTRAVHHVPRHRALPRGVAPADRQFKRLDAWSMDVKSSSASQDVIWKAMTTAANSEAQTLSERPPPQ